LTGYGSSGDSTDEGVAARLDVDPLDDDFLDAWLAAVAVEGVHLSGEQRHQLAREAEVDSAAPSGLLEVNRPANRIRTAEMCSDHLDSEHRLNHVLRTDLMHQRQRKVCCRTVDRLTGLGVQGVQKLSEQSLSDHLVYRPERSKERGVKILKGRRSIEDWFDDLPAVRLCDLNARRGHGGRRHSDGGLGRALLRDSDRRECGTDRSAWPGFGTLSHGGSGHRIASPLEPADLPARRFGDDQRIRRGQGLQPGGKVRGLADDPALLRRAFANQVANHGKPGGDAEPHAQILSPRQLADRRDHRQPGAHRPLGIVLMRLRIAEIDQHTVAHVFGDKAVETTDRIDDGTVVVADQLAQILRVMTGRERGRAD
jgi:hypothetical protein